MNKEKNTFRISGWYVPKADKKIFDKIKKSGLNHIFLQGDNVGNDCRDLEKIEEYLTLCDEVGLEAYVQRGRDTRISYVIEKSEIFARHECFKGFLIYDEPGADQYKALSDDYIEYAKSRGEEFFINLLPSYARGDQILDDYELYVRRFSDEVLSVDAKGEKWISFDFYPLMYGNDGKLELAERWLYDTRIIANEKKRKGFKSNAFVQTMPFSYSGQAYGSRERIPTYDDLSLQVYTYLAFGFDGVSYFCVGTPSVDFEFRDSHYAMFDRDGNTTEIYNSVERLNKNISRFVDEYVKYTWDTTYLLGGDKDECYAFLCDKRAFLPTDKVKEVLVDGNVLLGTFYKSDGEALVIVNFGEPTMQKIKTVDIQLDGLRRILVFKGELREELVSDRVKIELCPGKCAFVEIK